MLFPLFNRPFILPIFRLLTSVCSLASQAAEPGRFLGAREMVYPDWFKDRFLDLRGDIAESAEAGRRVMIFFHQNGCSYCSLMV